MSTIILSIGLMVFLSHFLSLAFKRTQIPDVLVLMGTGLLLGPVLGWVSPADFGKVGSVIATIALVVILFESGTSLRLDVMRQALSTTVKLTVGCFLLTGAVIVGIATSWLQMGWMPALLLGVILAGTSSAVVIPMVEALRLGDKPGTVLVLESALTDVLCIVGVFALLQVAVQGHVEPGKLIGGVLSSLVFAAVIGFLGGVGWLLMLGKMRDFPNTISSTLAYAFIVYGVSEFLGFSGAIAAMALGLTLTNFQRVGSGPLHTLAGKVQALTDVDLAFYKEAVFLLKTYFFVYLGLSIQFSESRLVGVAAAMMVAVYALRTLLVRYVAPKDDYSPRDAAMTSILAPKGLAAAVLASVPLQNGVAEGALIRDTAYMVVLVSICLTALLVIAYPRHPVRAAYGVVLGRRERAASDASA